MDRLKLAIESLQTHIDYDNRAKGMQTGIITIGIAEAEALLELLKEQDEEHRRLLSWLGKFCRHIDNGDAWLTDEENIAFFKEKMYQQFGWEKT